MAPSKVITRFNNCYILRESKIIKEDLWIRDGKIENPATLSYLGNLEADVTVDCKGLLIAPGFIDLQINGGWGVDFSYYDGQDVEEGVRKVSKKILAYGVTSFCPTVVSCDVTMYRQILPHIKKTAGGPHGATVLGIHLEGPFINQTQRGAHTPEFVIDPIKGLKTLKETYGSLENVAIITIAPELPGALDAIKGLTDMGIKVSLGHSAASLAEAEKGVECGAYLITHLFRAMSPFHHLDPRLLGLLAASTKHQMYYGIIAHELHTHPAVLRIVNKTNPEGLVLVSDTICAQGLADGDYRIGTELITMEGGNAYTTGTNLLYGNTSALDKCVATLKKSLDCSTEYALDAATLHPAKALGIDHKKGRLNFGYDADFVMIHPKTLKIESTWIAGECVYKCDKNI